MLLFTVAILILMLFYTVAYQKAQNEFQSQTGVLLLEKLQDVLTAASAKILQVAKKKRHLAHFFSALDMAASSTQPLHKGIIFREL